MDKIWYRNPSKSEVIGRCGRDEKTNDHAEPTKVERYKKTHTKNVQINLTLQILQISIILFSPPYRVIRLIS